MKKRNLLNGIVFVVILLLIIVGIMWCLKYDNKLKIIENKYGITEKEKSTNDVIVVDVTNLDIGNNFNHTCVLFSNYSNDEHWNECKICGKMYDISKHSYIDNGWSLGNTCNPNNVHRFTCKCGHSYETQVGKPECNYSMNTWTALYKGNLLCSNCNCAGNSWHDCKKVDGSRISCANLGTCVICNYNYNATNAVHLARCDNRNGDGVTEGDVNCNICNMYLGKISYSYLERISDTVYKYHFAISIPNGFQYVNLSEYSPIGTNCNISSDIKVSGNLYTNTTTITFNKHAESVSFIELCFNCKVNGMNTTVDFISENVLKADTVKPTISGIDRGDSTEWSKVRSIIISGTENYCSSVRVKIVEVDNDKNIVFEGQAKVSNQKFSISCTPEIEAGLDGKIYKCIVTDNCENSVEEIFEITKIDSVPPNSTSNDSVSDVWEREKLFTFSAVDYGVGDVEIAFNDRVNILRLLVMVLILLLNINLLVMCISLNRLLCYIKMDWGMFQVRK